MSVQFWVRSPKWGNHIMAAMVYSGRSRLVQAWLMARASYAYTRSWDGCEGPDGEPMSFGRWYAFTGAVETFWDHLWHDAARDERKP